MDRTQEDNQGLHAPCLVAQAQLILCVLVISGGQCPDASRVSCRLSGISRILEEVYSVGLEITHHLLDLSPLA